MKAIMQRGVSVLLAVILLSIASIRSVVAAESAALPSHPNILLILADDMGFADAGCYGSEIATPNLDRLAANGVRFTQFYNTGRCWPTRSALLTGYYPQQIRMDPPRGRLPEWTRLLPHYLRPLGYRSYHSGKWHINGAPRSLADGGFDRSYRLEDHDRNFYPTNVWLDDVRLPAVSKGSKYYTTVAFADFMIGCLKEHAEKFANRPFFAYLAFTVPHFPLQAPAEDIARYRDRYMAGWDIIREQRYQRQLSLGLVNCALSDPEPGEVPRWNLTPAQLKEQIGPGEVAQAVPWNDLTQEQQQFQAGKMAIHAAMIDRMDHEIGRVLEQIKTMGALDNTIVIFASDNGTSAEFLNRGDKHDKSAAPGSGGSFLCLGPGWSTAGNTPFRLHKSWVHEGGISTPLIVQWPNGIRSKGEWRHTPGHVIDIVPTLLELAGASVERKWNGVEAPAFPGRSLAPAFTSDVAVPRDFLYFHHDHNRALRIGDWKLVSKRPDTNQYALYDLSRDRSERVNLAGQERDRVASMARRWESIDADFRKTAGPWPPPPKTNSIHTAEHGSRAGISTASNSFRFAVSPPIAGNALLDGSPFGINTAFDPDAPDLDSRLAAMQQAGIKWGRQDFTWWRIEKNKGEYDWSRYDALVEKCFHHGVLIFGNLTSNPRFYDMKTAEAVEAYAAFARAAVKRYATKMDHWQIWNEPNLGYIGGDAGQYAKLLTAGGNAIHEANPKAKVLAMNMAFCDVLWAGDVLQRVPYDVFDIVCFHPYRNPNSPEDKFDWWVLDQYVKRFHPNLTTNYPLVRMSFLEQTDELINTMIKFGQPKPLWVTEICFNTHIHPYGLSELRQADLLVRFYVQAVASRKIEKVFWWTLKDGGGQQFDAAEMVGLMRDDLTPKYAYQAYSVMTRQLEGKRWIRNDAFGPGVFACVFTDDAKNQDTIVAWANKPYAYARINNGEAGLTQYDVFGTKRVVSFNKQRTSANPFPFGESPIYIVGPKGLKVNLRPDPGW